MGFDTYTAFVVENDSNVHFPFNIFIETNELYTAAHNLDVDVAKLKSRVTALENKAGG